MEQVDPPVDNETEEGYRPQRISKGGKHDLRARWAEGHMGWEARSASSCMCTVYPQGRLGLEMDELYAHVSSACTDQEVDRKEQDFPALGPLQSCPSGGRIP